MTDTIDSHTDASGEPTTGTDLGSPAGAAIGARTSTVTLERPAPVPRAGALPTPGQDPHLPGRRRARPPRAGGGHRPHHRR
ncbi:hypothetical protein [Actinomyces sp. Marseille-P3109]|uniref:hypothetical protein n=1 Tax=Actinomyces sp. Marseille-P3109 TaxID=2083009 RepID=UPI001F1DCC80|nr:hypothetical protein [Actinomyces sp. Marseille-P3109]